MATRAGPATAGETPVFRIGWRQPGVRHSRAWSGHRGRLAPGSRLAPLHRVEHDPFGSTTPSRGPDGSRAPAAPCGGPVTTQKTNKKNAKLPQARSYIPGQRARVGQGPISLVERGRLMSLLARPPRGRALSTPDEYCPRAARLRTGQGRSHESWAGEGRLFCQGAPPLAPPPQARSCGRQEERSGPWMEDPCRTRFRSRNPAFPCAWLLESGSGSPGPNDGPGPALVELRLQKSTGDLEEPRFRALVCAVMDPPGSRHATRPVTAWSRRRRVVNPGLPRWTVKRSESGPPVV